MAFGRARADDEGTAKTTANGKRPLSTSEKDILAAMASDSESDDETARVLAREELAAVPPSTLTWGDEDDEDDATRAAKPRKQASSSKRGGWLARLNAAHEQKEASVRDLSRSERRAANDAEKRQRKKAAALGASTSRQIRSGDASKANDEDVNEPASHVGSAPNRTGPEPASSGDPATLYRYAKRVVALALLAAALFLLLVAAVYLDSNRPDLWPPIWRLRGAKKLSAAESLAFARALANEAAERLATTARGAADGAAAEAAAALAAAGAGARVAAASVAAEVRWARDAAARLLRSAGAFVAAKAGR